MISPRTVNCQCGEAQYILLYLHYYCTEMIVRWMNADLLLDKTQDTLVNKVENMLKIILFIYYFPSIDKALFSLFYS